MEQNDTFETFGGEVTMEVLRDSGNGIEVIARETHHNLVTNTGKRQIWRVTGGLNANLFKFFRIGINSAAAVSADTNVKTACKSSLRTANSITMSGRTYQLVVSYQSGSGTTAAGILSAANIKEVCVLNQWASPGGSALMRAVFSSSVNKTKSDKLKVTYNVRIS